MPRLPKKADVGVIVPVRISADELNDRQIKGAELHKDGERSNGKVILLNDTTTLYFSSKSNSAYQVTRESRNLRGTRQTEYRCDCGDFKRTVEFRVTTSSPNNCGARKWSSSDQLIIVGRFTPRLVVVHRVSALPMMVKPTRVSSGMPDRRIRDASPS
jgi:ribosomal protein L24E